MTISTAITEILYYTILYYTILIKRNYVKTNRVTNSIIDGNNKKDFDLLYIKLTNK